MDKLTKYREVIRSILTEHSRIQFSYGEMRLETVFDSDSDRYVVVVFGRDHDGHRVNFCLIHIDIIDGKIWIHIDVTEDGVANELVAAGISKQEIVLGFKPPHLRKYTEFAPA